jgi:hypothetical protein
MTNDGSADGGSNRFGRLSTLVTLARVGRAVRRGNTGWAALLIGSVLLGRRSPRLGYLLQFADTAIRIYEQRK